LLTKVFPAVMASSMGNYKTHPVQIVWSITTACEFATGDSNSTKKFT